MGFSFLMMLLVIGLPLVGIIVLIVWLANRSKK
jgi:heme/copper-type cytochrome/quinol oxidase subunit 2